MPLDQQVEAMLNEMAASGAPTFAAMTVDEAHAL